MSQFATGVNCDQKIKICIYDIADVYYTCVHVTIVAALIKGPSEICVLCTQRHHIYYQFNFVLYFVSDIGLNYICIYQICISSLFQFFEFCRILFDTSDFLLYPVCGTNILLNKLIGNSWN